MPTSSSRAAATSQYGHKLNLTTGRSGLILDLVIEAGNPADSERLLPMLERHIAFYGAAPRQAAADGGFASRDNLTQAKACGVRDMAFHKKSGLRIEDMVRSRWVYRKLRNFRAGIEAGISCLKRAYGLARCTWRGLDHFKAYVWSALQRSRASFVIPLRAALLSGAYRATPGMGTRSAKPTPMLMMRPPLPMGGGSRIGTPGRRRAHGWRASGRAFERDALDRSIGKDPGVVHQDVEASEDLNGPLDG